MWLVVTVYRVGLELKKKKRWGPDHICPKLTGKKKLCNYISLLQGS